MPLETLPFDPALYLTDAAAQTELIDDALASGNTAYIANALGVVARARGMSNVSRVAGLSRESLYKALSHHGNPELSTILKVLHALGLRLSVRAA